MFPGFREVSKDEFFKTVGQLNVHPWPRNVPYKDPTYGSDWKLPNGEVIGKNVDVGPHKHYKPDSRYFVKEEDR